MTAHGRRVWTVLGGMIAGFGVGNGAQAFLGQSSNLGFCGVLLGLGIGVMVMCANW
ncbi:MAG: hypothetical protein QOC60_4, partial [Frankiaceae bacterium]|nr:hypothetical protein [Frankiaceae bacterium]